MSLMRAVAPVRDRRTRETLVPLNAGGGANRPMAGASAACHSPGPWPFTRFRRVRLAPSLVISERELVDGLEILDHALEGADQFCEG